MTMTLATYVLLRLVMVLFIGIVISDDPLGLPSCRPEDFRYEYTQCDSTGKRWLVSVPAIDCFGASLEAPVRGRSCDYSCKAGQYLDLKQKQECQPCQAGQYSLGGGVRYDSWEKLPPSFSIELEEFSSPVYAPQHYYNDGKANCTGVGWLPRDRYLVTDLSECTSVLVYVADLVTSGSVTFTYQSTDNNLLFMFEVQNSKCQTVRDKSRSRYLRTTEEGEWKEESIPLNPGVNRLYWRAFSTTFGKTQLRKNAMIQKIEITGVGYTSECTLCPAGTYSKSGASYCAECPPNTYSDKGARLCMACLIDQYSESGSSKCEVRPACTVDDYFPYNSPCNKNAETQQLYKWMQPEICNPSLPDSVQLPERGLMEPCPPCNPGMEMKDGKCAFCPINHFSDGVKPCAPCPGSTAPETGLVYRWWNNLPNDANITFLCLSPSGRSCLIKDGWTKADDHIQTLKGNPANVYSLVTLAISGFKGGQQQMTMMIPGLAADAVVYGTISFVFETSCMGECSFLFIQHVGKDLEVIAQWYGNTPKTKYIYNVTSDVAVNFSWSFQQQSSDDDNDDLIYSNRLNDVAKIYVISVTNTLRGGADHCKTCPKGTVQDRCIPCPAGSYVDPNSAQCLNCPEKTIVRGLNPWGVESCVTCGEGLEPYEHTTCISQCSYKMADNVYDFTPLAGVHTIEGPHLFTTSGYKYYHIFNISLCHQSTDGKKMWPLASCYSNVTNDQERFDETSKSEYQLPICRSTILPNSPGDPSPPVSINPLSLSDVLVAVTNNAPKYNITGIMKDAKFYSTDNATQQTDVHFIFMSDLATKACKNGRRTVITLRCDTKETSSEGKLSLPSHCPDGTCDGCNFIFLWTSAFACPICSQDDYTEFKENCIDGKQRVIKRPQKLCYPDTVTTEEVECSIFWQDSWPFWLKIVIVCIPVIVITGLILFIAVCYCWMKNKKLEYKYMKLIESSSGRDGELPAVDTCALDEGEEEEQFDAVDFKKKSNFFGKLTSYSKRTKGNLMLESIGMNEKSPLT